MRILSKVKIVDYLSSLTTDEVEVDKLINVCRMDNVYSHILDIKNILSAMRVGDKVDLPLVRYESIRSSCSRWGKLWGQRFSVAKTLNNVQVTRTK